MAERHRAIAARDKEKELQEVFGCSFSAPGECL